MAWMYMLECSDGSYYVGSTTDLERRLWQHNRGEGAIYTARRRSVTLVFAAEFPSIADAYAAEKQVQGWRRDKREALIRGDYDALPELAQKIFPKSDTTNDAAQAPKPVEQNFTTFTGLAINKPDPTSHRTGVHCALSQPFK